MLFICCYISILYHKLKKWKFFKNLLFISLLPSGQHIKKTAALFVQRFLLGFLFSLSLALLSLWDLLQICTYTANDSFSKHLQVRAFFSPSEWFSSNDLKECGRDGEIHFQAQSSQSISPFFPLLIVLQIKTQTNTWLPCRKLDIKNSIWLWQHWLSFDRFIERRGL